MVLGPLVSVCYTSPAMSDSVKHSPTGFNDIRDGLRERITLLEDMASDEQAKFTAEQDKIIAAYKQKMDSYRSTIASYKRLLELEEGFVKHADEISAKIGPKQVGVVETKMPIPPALPPLGDFFCAELIQRGNLSKEQLRQLAFDAGYFPTSEGGRATHATLVNLTRAGRVMALKDNVFSAREREKAFL